LLLLSPSFCLALPPLLLLLLLLLQEVFARQLRQLDPFRELGDEDVRTAIKNSSGVAGMTSFC
jgi:hypothetical protein